MENCAIVKRMKAACPNMQPELFCSQMTGLGAEIEEIATLFQNCLNDEARNDNVVLTKYFSKIDRVKSFLPNPESYSDFIVNNCPNTCDGPKHPEFYTSEVINVSNGMVIFKSVFSMETVEESLIKFVVIQVGQRASLILLRKAQIALLQSSPELWSSLEIFVFLLSAEAVESCLLLAAYDHLSCRRCSEIMDSALMAYQDFLNIFRAFGDELTSAEEDLMIGEAGTHADIKTICQRLESGLVNNFGGNGNDLRFKFSMFYFYLGTTDVTALRSAQTTSVASLKPSPHEDHVERCVSGLLVRSDPYMLACALYVRGCFRSASGKKGSHQERKIYLLKAERDFMNVCCLAKACRVHLASVPWRRLIEKASVAYIVTHCRLVVRCASSTDVEGLRKVLDHHSTLMKSLSARRSPWTVQQDFGSLTKRRFTALASLAFLYLMDRVPSTFAMFEESEKLEIAQRRARCESKASRLLEEEQTFSFCLKVFSDLSKEVLDEDDAVRDEQTQLNHFLHLLKLLSIPTFAAVSRSDSTFRRSGALAATNRACAHSTELGLLTRGGHNEMNRTEYFSKSDNKFGRSSDSDAISPANSSYDNLEKYKSPGQIAENIEENYPSANFLVDVACTDQENFIFKKLENPVNSKAVNSVEKENEGENKVSAKINLAAPNAEMNSINQEITSLDQWKSILSNHSVPHSNCLVEGTSRTESLEQNFQPPASTKISSTVNSISSDENIENWTESSLYDLILDTRPHFNCRAQSNAIISSPPRELETADPPTSESNQVIYTDTKDTKQKTLRESLKADLIVSLNSLNGRSSACRKHVAKYPIEIDPPKSNQAMSMPVNVSKALDDFVSTILEKVPNLATHNKSVPKAETESPFAHLDDECLSDAHGHWVAKFPEEFGISKKGELSKTIESDHVAPLEANPVCPIESVSGSVPENEASVTSNPAPSIKTGTGLRVKATADLFAPTEKPCNPQSGGESDEEDAVEFKFKNFLCDIPEDTERWLVFLRWSSQLTRVEDKLEDLFFIDGTSDVLCLKNTIANELRNLCRTAVRKQDMPCSDNQTSLATKARNAYSTALQHLISGSGLADLHFLLLDIFEVLEENPFSSAARWT